jgi:hypothetical protein
MKDGAADLALLRNECTMKCAPEHNADQGEETP